MISDSYWLVLAHREDAEVRFLVCVCSSWDEPSRLICGGGAIPHNNSMPSTLVRRRHPEMALPAAFRIGSIFVACDDLLA